MTDKERLSQINFIARRAFVSAGNNKRVLQDLSLIMALCDSSDEYLERNAKQFEILEPIVHPWEVPGWTPKPQEAQP